MDGPGRDGEISSDTKGPLEAGDRELKVRSAHVVVSFSPPL